MIAVAKRGSAKIMTPAADWIRCAQVREPTTRKKASWILRCSQMMPVRPQNTSRWPRWRRIGVSVQDGSTLGASSAFTSVTRRTSSDGRCAGEAGRRLRAGGPQLEQELGSVREVGGIGRQRDVHLLPRIERPGQ